MGDAMEIRTVGVEDVLRARDARVKRQRALISRHGAPLISLTMNIAGAVKRDAVIQEGFFEGVRRVEKQLAWHGATVLEAVRTLDFTGCEQIWAVRAEAAELKVWMRAVEEADALGRLLDVDVIGADGAKLERSAPRRCLICGGPAQFCARSRVHSGEELYHRVRQILTEWRAGERAAAVAERTQRALLTEALVAPKPALVDRENSGAHRDMDIFSFAGSAAALRVYFEACARLGGEAAGDEDAPEDVLERLRFLGRRAEEDMLRATGGANTHRGAIFSLGLLCWAAGTPCADVEELTGRAARIAGAALRELERLTPEQARTGGERQYLEFGLTGVRGEAASGFPSVRGCALPALREALAKGMNLNDACLRALLALMARVDDSNILRRGGMECLRRVQAQAGALLARGCGEAELRALDARLVVEGVSPGGSADLLAVACFLHFLEEDHILEGEVQP